MPKKFWMVWRSGSHGMSHRHTSVTAAAEEAKRLASKDIGATFYVLEAVLHVVSERPPVSVSPVSDEAISQDELTALDKGEIPF